ncbi:MAG: hypothetical protein VXZ96_12035 [Myxococcota bacterium]|nr:hypothetical protein [Myxococcota bacterium]
MSRLQVLAAVCIGILIATVLGVFILPREVKSTRWMEVDAPESVVWSQVYPMKSWSAWNIWGNSGVDESQAFWRGQSVQITDVDLEKKQIKYAVVGQNASGLIALDQQPDQLWIQWEHEYEAGYMPLARLTDWAARSELALQLDQALKSIRQVSEAEK